MKGGACRRMSRHLRTGSGSCRAWIKQIERLCVWHWGEERESIIERYQGKGEADVGSVLLSLLYPLNVAVPPHAHRKVDVFDNCHPFFALQGKREVNERQRRQRGKRYKRDE